MVAAFQIVRRRWPKAERAAEFATKRARWPWVFATDAGESYAVTRLYELDGLEDRVLGDYEGHVLSFRNGVVAISLVGAARFHTPDLPGGVEIARNGWLQIIRNFREINQKGAWFFGEYRLNVGVFDRLTPEVFLERKPRKICDLRRHVNSRKAFGKHED